MGQTAIIFAAVLAITGAVILAGIQTDTGRADYELSLHQSKKLAEEGAKTALALTVRKLAAEAHLTTGWSSGDRYAVDESTYNTTRYMSTVTRVNKDTVDVVATGLRAYVSHRGEGRDTTHVIRARYARAMSDGGVPPGFKYAIITDLQLDIRGDVFVHSLSDSLNASIHSNTILDVRGNSVVVEGYGTWTEGVSRQTKEENFVPIVDWNGDDSNVFYEPYVEIPSINMQALHDQATIRIIGEDFTIDGDVMGGPMGFYDWAVTVPDQPPPPLDIGTKENPFILFVGADSLGNGGNLFLQNDVDILGYGILVAQGNVFIEPFGEGNGVGGQVNGNEVTLAIQTVGYIDVAGNPGIVASLYSKCDRSGSYWDSIDYNDCGYIEFHGTPEITGGLVADETFFHGAGTLQVNYAAPSEAIIDPGFEFKYPIGPVLIAYNEF